jgi:riboflavin kinase/FMN adenylyltransferase
MLPTIIKGTVTRFKGDGRKLGYPTANLKVETDLKDGVYFGHADLAEFKNHPAIIFVGTPTTMGETDRRVEAHLLDIPDQDYYDQAMTLYLEHFHRSNETFKSIKELQKKMKNDETTARGWLTKIV